MLLVARNLFFKLAGAAVLLAVWAKHRLRGYRKPNMVSGDDRDARLAYVHDVVESWLRFLPEDISFRDRRVLELGPGSSLATGALLLAHGAKSYTAVDAFRLADGEDNEFRRDAIASFNGNLNPADIEAAHGALEGRSPNFQYHVDLGFDVSKLCAGQQFDMIVSCAAFEHFDTIEKTIHELTQVAHSGCVSMHIVDLQTHTNVLRTRDPNNIYRFSDWFYSLLTFPGQPNRKRPRDYVSAFEKNGWVNIEVIAAKSIPPEERVKLTSGLAKRFGGPDMHILDAVIISRYP